MSTALYSSGTLFKVVHHCLVSLDRSKIEDREREMSGCHKGWYLGIPPDFVGTA